jgi:hypothetical protein
MDRQLIALRYEGKMESICIPNKTIFIGKGVKFERIRRITGYLVGTLDRFNDAKRAEEADRVKHGVASGR